MLVISLHLLLWAQGLTFSSTWAQSPESVELPDITNAQFIETCLKEHNKHRSNVDPEASDMRKMTWDEALAVSARGWARYCKFSHNPLLEVKGKVHPYFSPVGENIWVGTPIRMFSVEQAIQKWNDEVKDYKYNTNTCRGVCGHYTQIVWASSYKVGCAVHACRQGIESAFQAPSVIFVCNYGDAGNRRGHHPYINGSPCSACSGEHCCDKLCCDAKHDAPKQYDWNPTASQSGNKAFCIAVLSIRPLALLCTMLTVLGLQHIYPNLFVYD